jgi:hypothetical protein
MRFRPLEKSPERSLRSRLQKALGPDRPSREWSWPGIEFWKPLWLLAFAALILGWWSPVTLAGAILILLCSVLITQKLFAAIGLALIATPFGYWLIEHPHPLAIVAAAAVCGGLLWWYRDSIRASL